MHVWKKHGKSGIMQVCSTINHKTRCTFPQIKQTKSFLFLATALIQSIWNAKISKWSCILALEREPGRIVNAKTNSQEFIGRVCSTLTKSLSDSALPVCTTPYVPLRSLICYQTLISPLFLTMVSFANGKFLHHLCWTRIFSLCDLTHSL